MSDKVVHVVGTGTIGEPLIGLLSDYKEPLGIGEVTFHKNSPLTYERAKVKDLMRRGAALAVDEEKMDSFKNIDLEPSYGACLLYTSPSPRDATLSRMPSSA